MGFDDVDASATRILQGTVGAGHASEADFRRRAQTLHEVALQIDASRGRDEIVKVLSETSMWVVPHDVSFLALLDRFRRGFEIIPLVMPASVALTSDTYFPEGTGLIGSVMTSQAPLLPMLQPPLEGHTPEAALCAVGIRSLMILPLRAGDQMIGAFVLGGRQLSAYSSEEVVLGQLLSSHVALAFANSEILDDAKRRLSQIELVNEVAEKLTSTLDLRPMLLSVARTLRVTYGYFDVTLFTIDREAQEVVLAARSGERLNFVPEGYRQKLSVGMVGWAATHGEIALANNVAVDTRYFSLAHQETKAELAIPIIFSGEVIGVLNIEDMRQDIFDDTDVIVLETICGQLGSAIRNAVLFEELRKSNAKLTELDKMKSEFLGIVSHDFRSPLSSIVMAGRSLLNRNEGLPSSRVEEYLRVIVDQANRLISLAEDTLSVTQMEAGKLTYYFQSVNLERVVNDAASMVLFSKRHTLDVRIDKEAAHVRADHSKLRQVMQNLISNAVKYSPEGGIVSIYAVSEGADKVEIRVSDEGIGIPADQAEKLFQKFSRINTIASQSIKGSGLGLWICREIVKAHGGEIGVVNSEAKGSVFRILLPKPKTASGLSLPPDAQPLAR